MSPGELPMAWAEAVARLVAAETEACGRDQGSAQEQAEEVEALAAIFGSDCAELAVEPVRALELTARPAQPASLRGLEVDNPPPVRLAVVLPVGYPEEAPPRFALACEMLSGALLSRLARRLDELWEESCGSVVLYTWMDFLREDALPSLRGADGSLAFEQGSSELDARVVVEARSEDDAMMRSIRHDAQRAHERFLEARHTCMICFTEKPGRAFVRTGDGGCQHAFCSDCVAAHAEVHVRDGSLDQLRCLEPKCGQALGVALLKELLPTDMFERWEKMTYERALDKMPDVVYCPRCKGPVISSEDDFGQCEKCMFAFCTLCNDKWHPGRKCMDAEARLEIINKRMSGNRSGGEQLLQKQKELVNELQAKAYVFKTSKQCPTCSMAIQKTEGCNKMTCSNCGTYFCYRCGKNISVEAYAHFKEGCVLFDDDTIRAWEAQMGAMAPQQVVNLAQGNLGGGVAVPSSNCPTCGQHNFKFANSNDIRCFNCRRRFCYRCRADIPKGAIHFGRPPKCPHHSAD